MTTDANVPTRVVSNRQAHIDIVTAGPMPADPANLLSSQRMRELMV